MRMAKLFPIIFFQSNNISFPLCFALSVLGGAGYHVGNLKWAAIALLSPLGPFLLVSLSCLRLLSVFRLSVPCFS